jgi:hypothetical protein
VGYPLAFVRNKQGFCKKFMNFTCFFFFFYGIMQKERRGRYEKNDFNFEYGVGLVVTFG